MSFGLEELTREVVGIATSQKERMIIRAVNRHTEKPEDYKWEMATLLHFLTCKICPLGMEKYYWDGEPILSYYGLELVKDDDKNTLRIETMYDYH